MDCKLDKNLTGECKYAISGIHSLWVLNIDDFQVYEFQNDKLYSEIYIDNIYIKGRWYELQTIDESKFTEKFANGGYTQELTTYISKFDSEIQAEMLKTNKKKFLVLFRTNEGRYFVFGSDGGVPLVYTAETGTKGSSIGYSVTLSKNSQFPLFEVNPDYMVNGGGAKFQYLPVFEPIYCELNTSNKNTGYQVATYAVKQTIDKGEALDINGNLCAISGKKQAIMILQGKSNPDSSKYESEGTFTPDSVLKGGNVVKKLNYMECRPEITGSITATPNLVTLTRNVRTKNVTIYSQHDWKLIQASDKATCNTNEGGAGSYAVRFDRNTNYGNGTFKFKNTYTQEEIDVKVQNLILQSTGMDVIGEQVTPTSNGVICSAAGCSIRLSIMCAGGAGTYSVATNISHSNFVTYTANTNSFEIRVSESDIEEEKTAVFTLTHDTSSDEKIIFTVTQEAAKIIKIPDFNFLTYRYFWTEEDGRDLDTATELVNSGLVDEAGNSIDGLAVGWNMKGNSNTEVTKYLKYGGDNRDSGNECTFIDMLALCSEEHLPNLPDKIYVDIYANWYGEKRNGYMTFEIKAYKGGEMVQDGYNFNNVGGEEVYSGEQSKFVKAACTSNHSTYKTDYTYVCRVTYDKLTREASIAIQTDDSGNDCHTT